MMPQDMPQHDDQAEDADMIKQVLQKIIDEMDSLEAGRIHPKMVAAKVDVAASPEHPGIEDDQPEPDADDQGLDPDVLKQLMDKAGSADDSGATPDDQLGDLHPDVAMAVRKKKGLLK